ncbi:acetyltransferase GNAT family [Penicillium cinerascens]|uniref:Acetyltransferase GNAT family n=1 Tax=Penicillium cinerascens TaxID=70096 RepID=A0A9W9JIB2_9EURO|nr:acetyltransferase GNAT family [Penicillium cinerascens]KAJ5194821.1 acetyltransferase GNAT family [Penicillium cinerascens]
MAVARPRGPLVSFAKASLPSSQTILQGRTVLLKKLEPTHAKDLFHLVGGDDPARTSLWDYMGDGPYPQLDAFEKNIASKSASPDPFFFAIIDKRSAMPSFGKAIGYLSLMRITPEQLCIEIGNVMFSPVLQRTVGATEAFYLLARHAFDDLGYRRLEWKCDSLNAPSRRSALRLGHTYEGIFRQHMIVKGRSRDTAWFSILKEEWNQTVAGAMEKWLDEANFRDDGSQIKTLQELRGD